MSVGNESITNYEIVREIKYLGIITLLFSTFLVFVTCFLRFTVVFNKLNFEHSVVGSSFVTYFSLRQNANMSQFGVFLHKHCLKDENETPTVLFSILLLVFYTNKKDCKHKKRWEVRLQPTMSTILHELAFSRRNELSAHKETQPPRKERNDLPNSSKHFLRWVPIESDSFQIWKKKEQAMLRGLECSDRSENLINRKFSICR